MAPANLDPGQTGADYNNNSMVRMLWHGASDPGIFSSYLANSIEAGMAGTPIVRPLVGERNPKLPPAIGPRSPYSPLACDAFEIIRRRGPISKTKLGEMLGGSVSNAGLDRALSELWAKLRITRVDYTVEEGSVWDELSRWAPEVVREGVGLSVPEALSALVSKYLDCVIAVDEGEVENFLANFVPRTRVKEAIHALLSARELSFVHVGSKSLLQVTPPKQAYVPKNRRPERVS